MRVNVRAILTMLMLCFAVVAAVWSIVSTEQSDEVQNDAASTAPIPTRLTANTTDKAYANRPIEVPGRGYVTSQTCQECHPHEYAMWHQSYHRTMTQKVGPETVLGDFDGSWIHALGDAYRHIRKGDQFFVEMKDPFWAGAGPATLVRRELVMSTGSHHMQVYWYESGDHRKVIQAPMAYLLREQRWVPVQSTFLKPPLQSMSHVIGGWNQACNMCHATGSRPGLQDPHTIDTQVSEFGIACEACHGPAEAHVRTQRTASTDSVQESNATEEYMFNPKTADPHLASDACGQCHGIWVARTATDFENWKAHGFAYRPGNELDASRYVMSGDAAVDQKHAPEQLQADPNFLRDRFWSDGMVRISGREYNGMIQSPCYKHGDTERGLLQCMSCHQMHPSSGDDWAAKNWANDQLAPGMAGNAACLQCHEEFAQRIEQHTHHAADSSGSECMNCHMPHTTYGLYKAIRSHQISSPSVQTSLNTGRPNACNQCHLDKTFGWAADHLQHDFEVPPPDNLRDLQRRYAAAPLWVLAGDAGQRAIVAWSMGWKPAQEASDADWMVPYLAQLLTDPYDAVRLIAYRSLQTIPGYREVDYDFLAETEERKAVANKVLTNWASRREKRARKELLIQADGSLHRRTWIQMYNARDNRPVNLEE